MTCENCGRTLEELASRLAWANVCRPRSKKFLKGLTSEDPRIVLSVLKGLMKRVGGVREEWPR